MYSPNIVTPDKWLADGINGDVLLCDPFTGVPLIAQAPSGHLNRPPDAFTGDIDLGGGYGVWKGSYEANERNHVEVGVLLTDPSDPNGLGTLSDLRENMGHFAVVGYANKGSLRREAMNRDTVQNVGGVTLGGEIVSSTAYMDTLFGVAAELDKELFSFDPEIDALGRPVGAAALGLQKVEDALRAEGAAQDLADADAAILGMDMVHCNTTQWHHVGRSGLELARIGREYDMFPPSALLIVPVEQHHLARKLQMSGAPNTSAVFARLEFQGIPEATSYPLVMEHGFIPGSALTD